MTAEQRPAGIPQGARLVTLAELKDDIAKENGSLRIGPRGSILRACLSPYSYWLRGRVSEVLGGGVSKEHGGRVFSLGWQGGFHGSAQRTLMVFLGPDAADTRLWIWTLDDERSEAAL